MAAAVPPPPAAEEEGAILNEFTPPILLADKILKLAQEAVSSRQECVHIAQQVDEIYRKLQATVRLISTTTQPLYERPIRRIVADVTKNLERALNFVSKCRHSGFLRQVFSMTTIADFRKVSGLLESSIGDMKWLISIFDPDGSVGLPPIASNDPTLAYIWPNIATIQMGSIKNLEAANQLTLLTRGNDRNQKIVVEEGGVPPLLKLLKDYASPDAQISAANVLINVASVPERVKSILDVLGVPIIVQALNHSSMRVQIVVANLVSQMAELSSLAQEEFARENVTKPLVTCLSIDMVLDDPKVHLGKSSFHSVVEIKKELVGRASDSSLNLNSSSGSCSSYSDGSSRGGHQRKEKEVDMVLDDPKVHLGKSSFHSVVEIKKELVGRASDSSLNLNSSSGSCSSYSDGSSRGGHQRKEKEVDMVLDDPKVHLGKSSFHSVVEIKKELDGRASNSSLNLNSSSGSCSSYSDGSSRGGHQRKEKEVESSEVKLQLKVNCAEALWRLSKGSISNSQKITETKGLLCMAKIIESEEGDLQYNCLMTVMEVTAVAESKPDFRHVAFKITSLAPKAILYQLSRLIQEQRDPRLQVPAIKSIGSLARIFPAKESQIIDLLVMQMKSINMDVALEAVVALGKFACLENYNCIAHSKSIIEFDGVPPLMKLLRQNEAAQVPGLKLLCYLALSAGNSKALEEAHALNEMKRMARLVFAHTDLHELYSKAIHHLTLYQAGAHHIHRHHFSP
ncbi:uncharacterized protein LOC111801955 isoform X1 [Cucurbita pepo subsp. pepo]|uniref:uncharacterized protein LOC111801955 isoform X1 n=1 Tax=Cucurbita pepo subsp. pepo TaxID=3664 RepID=UPI000C9D806D|nr:uncharacterized protein LOC111801955 isoform X1 [Cucurbita pepo subsp. pepo]XP_023541972.1 uncharacterized protein LOC111801955 isoform X1 [Cucurbita pepo subsp. pepo]XP_023541973.1 uncharacterized protein LOC111801955 isoform X1 [Cucurbita pepo subsp. pepo]